MLPAKLIHPYTSHFNLHEIDTKACMACVTFFFIWDPKLSTLTFLSSQPSVNAKCFIPIAKGTSAHQADHFSEGWP